MSFLFDLLSARVETEKRDGERVVVSSSSWKSSALFLFPVDGE